MLYWILYVGIATAGGAVDPERVLMPFPTLATCIEAGYRMQTRAAERAGELGFMVNEVRCKLEIVEN